jgi:AcrR family transcriptional regulator
VPALRRDAAENRERLVAAAEEVFSELGTEGTMEDVARAAGVGAATLYRRFPNKDTLAQAALERFFLHLIGLADAALRRPPEEGVEAFLMTVARELAAKRGLAHGLWGDLAPRALVTELEERTCLLVERARSVGSRVRTAHRRRHCGGGLGAARDLPIWRHGGRYCLASAMSPSCWRVFAQGGRHFGADDGASGVRRRADRDLWRQDPARPRRAPRRHRPPVDTVIVFVS